MSIEITTQIRLQGHQDYWHTVEDTHLDVGGPGITISYWETAAKGEGEKRIDQISLSENQAIAIARAILKLTNAQ
jgi:hypothetical protein